MKNTTTMLLAVALIGFASCSKSDSGLSSSYPAPDHYVPYWGNNETLSANGGSDHLRLQTVERYINVNGVSQKEISTHLTYNDHDYLVTNIDTNSNSGVDPIHYGGNKICIAGQGQRLYGTYTMSPFTTSSNLQSATFVLTITQNSTAAEFGNSMYTGEAAEVPHF